MITYAETMVRMGELAASGSPDEVLVSIGLGSCIGLALVDRRRRVAGLAHVMLPASNGNEQAHGKFADRAVPALLELVTELGAWRPRLEAVLVGGAQMFSLGGSALDIGARNEAAVLEALAAERIAVTATATRGGKGRTVRVCSSGSVLVKEIGGVPVELLPEART